MESHDKLKGHPTNDEGKGSRGLDTEVADRTVSPEQPAHESLHESSQSTREIPITLAERSRSSSINTYPRVKVEQHDEDSADAKSEVGKDVPDLIPDTSSESKPIPSRQGRIIEEVDEDTDDAKRDSEDIGEENEETRSDGAGEVEKGKTATGDWDDIVPKSHPDFFKERGGGNGPNDPRDDKSGLAHRDTDPDDNSRAPDWDDDSSDKQFEIDLATAIAESLRLRTPIHHGEEIGNPAASHSPGGASSNNSDLDHPDIQEGIIRSLQHQQTDSANTDNADTGEGTAGSGANDEDGDSDSELSDSEDSHRSYPLHTDEEMESWEDKRKEDEYRAHVTMKKKEKEEKRRRHEAKKAKIQRKKEETSLWNESRGPSEDNSPGVNEEESEGKDGSDDGNVGETNGDDSDDKDVVEGSGEEEDQQEEVEEEEEEMYEPSDREWDELCGNQTPQQTPGNMSEAESSGFVPQPSHESPTQASSSHEVSDIGPAPWIVLGMTEEDYLEAVEAAENYDTINSGGNDDNEHNAQSSTNFRGSYDVDGNEGGWASSQYEQGNWDDAPDMPVYGDSRGERADTASSDGPPTVICHDSHSDTSSDGDTESQTEGSEEKQDKEGRQQRDNRHEGHAQTSGPKDTGKQTEQTGQTTKSTAEMESKPTKSKGQRKKEAKRRSKAAKKRNLGQQDQQSAAAGNGNTAKPQRQRKVELKPQANSSDSTLQGEDKWKQSENKPASIDDTAQEVHGRTDGDGNTTASSTTSEIAAQSSVDAVAEGGNQVDMGEAAPGDGIEGHVEERKGGLSSYGSLEYDC